MDAYIFTDLVGTEGLFTFNFFCESLIGSLHTLHHVMEDNGLSLPERANDLSDSLAEMGANLLDDYHRNEINASRFQQELLDFYDLAFAINDELAPGIINGDPSLQYYYYVYMQGVNLFYPNMMQGIIRDIPESADLKPFIDEITQAFATLSTPS